MPHTFINTLIIQPIKQRRVVNNTVGAIYHRLLDCQFLVVDDSTGLMINPQGLIPVPDEIKNPEGFVPLPKWFVLKGWMHAYKLAEENIEDTGDSVYICQESLSQSYLGRMVGEDNCALFHLWLSHNVEDYDTLDKAQLVKAIVTHANQIDPYVEAMHQLIHQEQLKATYGTDNDFTYMSNHWGARIDLEENVVVIMASDRVVIKFDSINNEPTALIEKLVGELGVVKFIHTWVSTDADEAGYRDYTPISGEPVISDTVRIYQEDDAEKFIDFINKHIDCHLNFLLR